MKQLILGILLFISIFGTAQENPNWWYDLHDHEPGTSWLPQIVVSPGYLGPNALPIPDQVKGRVSEKSYVEAAFDLHTMKGDQAFNPFLRIFYSVANGKMAFEFYGNPFERYKTTTAIRNFRKSRFYELENTVAGEYFFATQIQIAKNKRVLPDMALRVGCKTAAGSLDEMRYTDSPAYWFDYSLGKDYKVGEMKVRPYGHIGFYCWQTTSFKWIQNDAYMFGVGADVYVKNIVIENALQGYSGYWNDLDKPLNYRFGIRANMENQSLKFQWQAGVRHVLYQSFRVSWIYTW